MAMKKCSRLDNGLAYLMSFSFFLKFLLKGSWLKRQDFLFKFWNFSPFFPKTWLTHSRLLNVKCVYYNGDCVKSVNLGDDFVESDKMILLRLMMVTFLKGESRASSRGYKFKKKKKSKISCYSPFKPEQIKCLRRLEGNWAVQMESYWEDPQKNGQLNNTQHFFAIFQLHNSVKMTLFFLLLCRYIMYGEGKNWLTKVHYKFAAQFLRP